MLQASKYFYAPLTSASCLSPQTVRVRRPCRLRNLSSQPLDAWKFSGPPMALLNSSAFNFIIIPLYSSPSLRIVRNHVYTALSTLSLTGLRTRTLTAAAETVFLNSMIESCFFQIVVTTHVTPPVPTYSPSTNQHPRDFPIALT